jgi:hypothetical protein
MDTDKHGFFSREFREFARIEFASIRGIRVKFFIRVHPRPSVVK